ncbi:MAG: CHAT domain-containing protein, partial [Cyanobacteria bacterium J06607_6]
FLTRFRLADFRGGFGSQSCGPLAYAAITLAKSYQVGRSFDCQSHRESPQVETWLETGRRIATTIGDDRAASFALGELGHLAECRGNLEDAAALTNQAQLAASNALESADSLYLWEWQIGRIYRLQKQPAKALAAYSQSIATLESIRTDILTADRELQFDFRDTVEPIYRQYIEMQLAASPDAAVTSPVAAIGNTRIAETLDTVDALRLAELQNFFGNDCVLVSSEGARERLLSENSQTAVISSIVLSDLTVLIASFPDGTAKTTWIEDTATLRQTADEFRRKLKRFRDLGGYDKRPAQTLYQQLIGAFEADFTRANINTLVFIHDGFLRNIPMAALHDGTQYLVQRYAVATTPSLSLTAPGSPRPADLRALAVGLSEATITESGREFSALDFVPAELASVAEQLPGSTTLLDAAFTVDQLQFALQRNQYPILHLATHGQFSTIPEDTFVVTGANDLGIAGELTFGQLETLIREASPNAEPVSLITLTACETATGDDRATLGLAGVAIRAGATSAIASLWKVNDETAAQLIESFYGH